MAKELIMVGAVIILMWMAVMIAYWVGQRNGMNKERKYIIGILKDIRVTEFAVDIQYGVSVAIGHMCDRLREEE